LMGSSRRAAERFRSAARALVPYLLASLVYLVPRYLVLKETMFRNPQAVDRPVFQSLITLPLVVCTYLKHLIWPAGLSVTYGTHFVSSVGSIAFLFPALIVTAAAFALLYWRKVIPRYVWIALLLLVAPLIPVLNLGQISREEYLVFDHYLYLPVAGFAFLIASALLGSAGRKMRDASRRAVDAKVVIAGVVLVASIPLSIQANRAWANSAALWSNAAKVSPGYWAPQYNAGVALLEAGDLEQARVRLESAARLKPDEAVVYDALGRAFARSGDRTAAVQNFKRALELQPDLFESHNNLGTVYFDAGDYQTAAACFEQALRLRPAAGASRYNLALCYLRVGKPERAASELEKLLETAEDAEACYQLGLAYEQSRQTARARDAFGRALRSAQEADLADRIRQALSRLPADD